MSKPTSPFEASPPSAKKILISVAAAIAGAAIVLVTIVLPAEYNIDPTRMGGALGLTALSAPAKTVQIADVVGGNEKYREVAIPDSGEPAPLPNPAVFQKQEGVAKHDDLTVTLKPGEQTEIKTLLKAAQVVTFSWFWLNISEQPVTVKLNVTGYYEKLIDYGIADSGGKASGIK